MSRPRTQVGAKKGAEPALVPGYDSFIVPHRHYWQDGPEVLLAHHLHAVIGVGDEGRLDESPLPLLARAPAGHDRRAF